MQRHAPAVKQHILLVSRKCPHSKSAHDVIVSKECQNLVKFVFVEDKTVRLPTWVRTVPVMVTNTGTRIQGEDLFWFLSEVLPTQKRDDPKKRGGDDAEESSPSPDDSGPAPFSTMGIDTEFSGSFSYIDGKSGHGIEGGRASSEAHAYQKIETPSEPEQGAGNENALSRLMSDRDRDIAKYFGKR